MFDHKRLDVYKVAREFVMRADRIVHQLPVGRAYIADQLMRAAISIVLNIAEGCDEFSRRDKARFYRMAKRSASECSAVLDIITDLKLVAPQQAQEADKLLERIGAMLTAMIHAVERPRVKARP
jgi:four helix bundle protein